MAQKPTPELRAEAVHIALTSGLTRKQVATDFATVLTAARRASWRYAAQAA